MLSGWGGGGGGGGGVEGWHTVWGTETMLFSILWYSSLTFVHLLPANGLHCHPITYEYDTVPHTAWASSII